MYFFLAIFFFPPKLVYHIFTNFAPGTTLGGKTTQVTPLIVYEADYYEIDGVYYIDLGALMPGADLYNLDFSGSAGDISFDPVTGIISGVTPGAQFSYVCNVDHSKISSITCTIVPKNEVNPPAPIPPVTPTFSVTFLDKNDDVIKIEQVEKGYDATAPTAPIVPGYIFTGWDTDFTNVQSNLTVKALYEKIPSYSVVFWDWDGTKLSEQTVSLDMGAIAPNDPSREGYTFIGWDTDFTNVQSNLTVKALYKQNTLPSYSVIFWDWDGARLSEQWVLEGSSAIAPSDWSASKLVTVFSTHMHDVIN